MCRFICNASSSKPSPACKSGQKKPPRPALRALLPRALLFLQSAVRYHHCPLSFITCLDTQAFIAVTLCRSAWTEPPRLPSLLIVLLDWLLVWRSPALPEPLSGSLDQLPLWLESKKREEAERDEIRNWCDIRICLWADELWRNGKRGSEKRHAAWTLRALAGVRSKQAIDVTFAFKIVNLLLEVQWEL